MNDRPHRILHTMLRVRNLEHSLEFYVGKLGMKLFRREEYPTGQFTLAFVGYDEECTSAAIELTYNWDQSVYQLGSAFGHVALAVADVATTCSRLAASGVSIVRAPGPMTHASSMQNSIERIAFIEDPDGYRVELIEVHDR